MVVFLHNLNDVGDVLRLAGRAIEIVGNRKLDEDYTGGERRNSAIGSPNLPDFNFETAFSLRDYKIIVSFKRPGSSPLFRSYGRLAVMTLYFPSRTMVAAISITFVGEPFGLCPSQSHHSLPQLLQRILRAPPHDSVIPQRHEH